jgi:UDP-glucose 4-epimerase
MKRILITGANSYIGTSFEKYVKENYPDGYVVDTVDMIDGTWREKDFSEYDSVFHVAGIAHQKETKQNAPLYYKVNRDLVIEVAKKAKTDGVKQFVFLSSMSVYGIDVGMITKDTVPSPNTNYGKSKLEAEQELSLLTDDSFCICVLRPPMVYGRGCKGNYVSLTRFAMKLPFFPYVNNERSMVYIENLSEFTRLMIENKETGVFYPQNAEYSNTGELVQLIAETHGKNICLVKGFGWALSIMGFFTKLVKKAFGSLTYSMDLSDYSVNYRIVGLKDSIRRTENE